MSPAVRYQVRETQKPTAGRDYDTSDIDDVFDLEERGIDRKDPFPFRNQE